MTSKEDCKLLYLIALGYRQTNKLNDAVDGWNKCIEQFHSSEAHLPTSKLYAYQCYINLSQYSFYILNDANKGLDALRNAYELAPTNFTALYLLGVHHYTVQEYPQAFEYLNKARLNINQSVEQLRTLFLDQQDLINMQRDCLQAFISVCYHQRKSSEGIEGCELLLQIPNLPETADEYAKNYYNYFSILKACLPPLETPLPTVKPIFAIVADGGFANWSGKSLELNGVGGSETYVIEIARNLAKLIDYEIVVFCRCDVEEIYEGVKYVQIQRFKNVAASLEIEHCLISRYSEYVPIADFGHVKNIHIIAHDLGLTCNNLPLTEKIKNVFCLTEWHKKFFLASQPHLEPITSSFHYGIDHNLFKVTSRTFKKPGKFIFSSFANRGLRTVLELWPKLYEKFSFISLDVYCNLDNEWLNQHYAEEVKVIRQQLEDLKDCNVVNHGWVSKRDLAASWHTADVWFYPCKFKETFCLTALEAAASQTLVVSNDLAALENTVGDRGLVVAGEATTDEWKRQAYNILVDYLNKPNDPVYQQLINKNYHWALEHSWYNRALDLTNRLKLSIVANEYETITNGNETYLIPKIVPQTQTTVNPKLKGILTLLEKIKLAHKPNLTYMGINDRSYADLERFGFTCSFVDTLPTSSTSPTVVSVGNLMNSLFLFVSLKPIVIVATVSKVHKSFVDSVAAQHQYTILSNDQATALGFQETDAVYVDFLRVFDAL